MLGSLFWGLSKMKKIFGRIWELALPYQDKRDDKGHAEAVTKYAIKLCTILKANEKIVIPAAILHDIGWSQLSERERFSPWIKNVSKEEKYQARLKHQEEGVKLAKRILEQVKYMENLIPAILEIISQHDTRKGFIFKEEGVMRDADKLTRFDSKDFYDGFRNNQPQISWEEHLSNAISNLERDIDEPGFFYSGAVKNIARKELEKRKKEFRY